MAIYIPFMSSTLLKVLNCNYFWNNVFFHPCEAQIETEGGDCPLSGYYVKIKRTVSLTGGLQGVVAEQQM